MQSEPVFEAINWVLIQLWFVTCSILQILGNTDDTNDGSLYVRNGPQNSVSWYVLTKVCDGASVVVSSLPREPNHSVSYLTC